MHSTSFEISGIEDDFYKFFFLNAIDYQVSEKRVLDSNAQM